MLMHFILEHKEKIFPVALIAMSLCAAGFYFLSGDIKKGIYWTAAAVLNVCVTF